METKNNFAKRAKALAISSVMLISSVFSSASSINIAEVNAAEVEVNFAKALQYSMYFYDANMCGTGVDENNLYSWRGDCHTYDANVPLNGEYTNLTSSFITANKSILDPDGDGTVDVAGGFHDAGDHVKFGMPENYSGATLGWGYYEFKDSYKTTGQSDHMETILRYFNDYFMKCTFRNSAGEVMAFCYQVGEGEIDHAYWNSPEIDEMKRKAFFLTKENPQTDYVVSAAASLAINYLNFKDSDPEYAKQNLDYAKALFDFAQKNEKQLSLNAEGPRAFYVSSKWEDDYCWAAAWLFLATENKAYLEEACKYLDYYAPSGWMLCWNDMWNGVSSLFGIIDKKYPELELQNMYRTAQNKTIYEDANFWLQIEKSLDKWLKDFTTPGGYAFFSVWGSARYNTAAQLIALVYDKYNGGVSKYGEWAKGQMEYLMGKNPLNRSYIVGYSDSSAKYPHHRAASGLSKCEDLGKHKYVLYGALVGGPDAKDQHNDVTSDWIYNEVTIDYNAAFVGACAGLYEFFGTPSMQVTPDFPPPIVEEPGSPTSNAFWVEAFCVDIAQEAPKVSEITLYVYTGSNKPAKNVSVRYYFDTKGMSSIDKNQLELRQLYDQTAAETDFAAELSGPIQYKGTVYYVEVSWPGYPVANSNKKYQFALGTYAYLNSWDPTDDWSHTGIKQEKDAFLGTCEKTDYICVYNDGVLVGGIEPDGSTPTTTTTVTTPKETTVTTTKPVTTTTVTTVSSQTTTAGTSIYGDLDGSGRVDNADLVILSRYLIKEITLSESKIKIADVSNDGAVDVADLALMKQKIMGDSVALGK